MKKEKKPKKCKHKNVDYIEYCNHCNFEEGICMDCEECVGREIGEKNWEIL